MPPEQKNITVDEYIINEHYNINIEEQTKRSIDN